MTNIEKAVKIVFKNTSTACPVVEVYSEKDGTCCCGDNECNGWVEGVCDKDIYSISFTTITGYNAKVIEEGDKMFIVCNNKHFEVNV